MKSVKVRSDFTVKLPREVRGCIRPGDSLDVDVRGKRIIYESPEEQNVPTLREMIERACSLPPASSPTPEELEEIIHSIRRNHR